MSMMTDDRRERMLDALKAAEAEFGYPLTKTQSVDALLALPDPEKERLAITDEMVERAARAWWAHDPQSFDALSPSWRALQITRARAALEAALSSDGGEVSVDADPSGVLQGQDERLLGRAFQLTVAYSRLEAAAREVVEAWNLGSAYDCQAAVDRLRSVLSESKGENR